MSKELKNDIAEAVKHIETAHKLLEEANGNTYQNLLIKSADSYLAFVLSDLSNLEETYKRN